MDFYMMPDDTMGRVLRLNIRAWRCGPTAARYARGKSLDVEEHKSYGA